MLSLILPYWNRAKVAAASIRQMAIYYRDLDMEIIVVDDGSPDPFIAPPDMPWPVRVIRLPAKLNPMNPCTPINMGVDISRGDIIAISNPENIHRGPVLQQMIDEIKSGAWRTYVMAAAWHVEGKNWHCHSSIGEPIAAGIKMPKGSHYHFLAMMRPKLWNAAGGFDDDYRRGAGYDDPDFVLRLSRAGAKFILRDDLIVDHVRTDARAKWTPEMFERNRRIFLEKWANK